MNSFEKLWFVASLVGLFFLYGVAVGAYKWFPHSFLDRAQDQAMAVTGKFWGDESESSPAAAFLQPRVYNWHGARTIDREAMQPGLTLVTSTWERDDGWDVGLKLMDTSGRTVHEWLIDRKDIFEPEPGIQLTRQDPEATDIQGSYLLPNGDVLINLELVGLARLNSCGEVLWTLKEGNHHSIERDDDGAFWTPAIYAKQQARSQNYPEGYPGIPEPVWLDRIVQVDATGKVLQDFPVLDILYMNGLERYLPKMLAGGGGTLKTDDVTHINDVEPLSTSMADEYPLFDSGDLLVSARNLHLVWVFDPESMEVKWHASAPWILQHDPDFVGNGWIGVFDNNTDLTDRGTVLGGSRIVGVKPGTDSINIIFPSPESEPFYTHHRGKWQLLENGNMLLTEEDGGRVVEAGTDGRAVWEWVHEPYQKSQVPSVTKAIRHDLTVAEVAAWPCSRAVSD